MAMVCPRCQQSYERELVCRECDCRLQFQAVDLDGTRTIDPTDDGQWQHTPWGKILVGLLLALGLSFGFQQLCTAGLLFGEDAGLPSTIWGLVLLHALQGLSVVVGGAITGAGQPRGLLYGSVVGLLSGGVFLGLQRHQGDGQPDVLLFAQPFLHLLLGAVGGMLGKAIWTPTPVVPLATNVPSRPETTATSQFFAGPIHYGRVFTGIFIVVAGVVWADVILGYFLRASSGSLAMHSHLQARLIGWEVAGLATLLGAGLAGATTFNGLKQGLCVGFGASIVVIGISLGRSTLVLESLVLMLSSVLVLSLAGGWFGGQLFPPVIARRRRVSHLN